MKQAEFKSVLLEILVSGGQSWMPRPLENPRCCSGLDPWLLDQNRLLFCEMSRVLYFEWRWLLCTATYKAMGLKIWLYILGLNHGLPRQPLTGITAAPTSPTMPSTPPRQLLPLSSKSATGPHPLQLSLQNQFGQHLYLHPWWRGFVCEPITELAQLRRRDTLFFLNPKCSFIF